MLRMAALEFKGYEQSRRARLHGSAADRVGDGGDEHPHRDHLPRRNQYRAAGCDQPQGNDEGMAKLYQRFGISPDRIANIVAFAIDQPEDTTVNEFTVGPANQPW